MRPLKFRKSSYSGASQNCVEVAPIPPSFRKSSYSAQGQECVEVAPIAPSPSFRKSSSSGHDVNCVEVADLPAGAALRDSKHPDAGYLAFPAAEWDAFISAARSAEL
ncbi:DUF397 domain-containing protein [Streptomonospora wellingtoniae]|uniref:DUF397 domain-containing protein n=1 Tax=Streptomonospora wellingtoniae TaxID=3075544 RepID=A0ABU2KN60_9ACTN|nr:DUF397 domain-containing protein [Streptomonospora sp. DSM 45055]MDT0300678.1 DUF397 domain-containing protein [Streptomonospora sp. DSM 45055]